MAAFDIQNICVYDDNLSDLEIIQNIIDMNNQEDAFYILDVETIVRQHKKWISAMPKVFPHYAVKCNPNDNIIRVIASINGKFDCASMQEIRQVMQAGVSGDRIVYANPNKPHSHIKFAKEVGVKTMMVHNPEEVLKIKEIYPEAKLVIRLAMDGDSGGQTFSMKFGCDPITEVITLMDFIKKHEMYLQGFSFHLGTPCTDSNAYGRGVKTCKTLIKTAKSMGFKEVNLIDIGGGFPGIQDDLFYKIAEAVNKELEDLDPSIEVISEPGRYYVQSAFTLATCIVNKRSVIDDKQMIKKHYYINDGVFGSFIKELMGVAKREPLPLRRINQETFQSFIWGQTCSPRDCVRNDAMIQDLSIGDWIIWRNMGSYSISNASTFNGYTPSEVFPIIRKSALKELLNDIDAAKESEAIKSNDEKQSYIKSDTASSGSIEQ